MCCMILAFVCGCLPRNSLSPPPQFFFFSATHLASSFLGEGFLAMSQSLKIYGNYCAFYFIISSLFLSFVSFLNSFFPFLYLSLNLSCPGLKIQRVALLSFLAFLVQSHRVFKTKERWSTEPRSLFPRPLIGINTGSCAHQVPRPIQLPARSLRRSREFPEPSR